MGTMKQTQYSNFLPIIIAVLCGLKSYASAEAPKTFRVNDLTFERPEAWNWERPSSQMRKAQLSAPGKDGTADIVFFYFGPGGAGGVQANVDRWMGQFQNVSGKKTESKKIGGIPITFVQASGTFLSGPPFGQKVPKAGYALRGACLLYTSPSPRDRG